MDIILLERVAKLGQMGEVVSVKEGYARNYLLPQGKALRANEVNLKAFEDQKAQLEARNLETKKEAEALAAKLDGAKFVVIRAASDGGSLYGSVSPRDIEKEAEANGYNISRKQVVIGDPIKELGLRDITVHLHPEVEATITLNIARSPEEAELQASGKSIQDLAAEEEAAAEFEIQELFEDIGASQLEDLEGEAGLVETPEGGDEEEKSDED
ncbi:50S ribosomal protein L9 [Salibaculum griseiflavum]|uniref:Large ribosomal subunit protein bL9 n=1 Tax=Salibaculum griseiflavum TaxID=1914409 RepID=A0A2V1P731_9RHOB|nr:50S ribosomal protein L9 [Salibaculum griseiflavum]PWG18289.1 50S ribosomal protein L9 [Salibaculum griseiflavum]